MDHDNAILIDGTEYSMSNCQTVYDMKKAIFVETGIFIKHVKAGETILLNSQKLLKYADTKLTGVLDDQTYERYKDNGWRCAYSSCRGNYNFETMSCYHTDKCKSKRRKIRLSNSSFSQVDMVSIGSKIFLNSTDNHIKETSIVFKDISEIIKNTLEENNSSNFLNTLRSHDLEQINSANNNDEVTTIFLHSDSQKILSLNDKNKASDSNFDRIEIFKENKNKENKHLNDNDKNTESLQENNIVLNNNPLSKIKQSAVANDTDNLSLNENRDKDQNYISHISIDSTQQYSVVDAFKSLFNLKINTTKNDESSPKMSPESTQVISLNEPQKDPILNQPTRLKLGKLKFRKIKQKRIIKFLKPMFSRLTFDQMMELSDTHDYIAIMRGKVILAGAVIKKFTASDDITYCDLVFIGVRPRRRGYGKMMINMLKKTYKKIIVCADNSIIDFYINSRFTQAKSLIYPLASQVRSFNKSLFMKFGFSEEEILKIKIWGTAVSDKILRDQKLVNKRKRLIRDKNMGH